MKKMSRPERDRRDDDSVPSKDLTAPVMPEKVGNNRPKNGRDDDMADDDSHSRNRAVTPAPPNNRRDDTDDRGDDDHSDARGRAVTKEPPKSPVVLGPATTSSSSPVAAGPSDPVPPPPDSSFPVPVKTILGSGGGNFAPPGYNSPGYNSPCNTGVTNNQIPVPKRHDDDDLRDDDAVSTIGFIATFEPIAPSQYVYNVPDAFEQNAEVLRAERLFFNTPLSEAYAQDVYDSLKNVQEQCSYDYNKFCMKDSTMLMQMDFEEVLNAMFNALSPSEGINARINGRRALSNEDNQHRVVSVQVFDYFHQFYTGEALSSLMPQGAIAPISGPVVNAAKANHKNLSDRIPEAKSDAVNVEELAKKTVKHGSSKRFFAKAQDRRSLMMEHHHDSEAKHVHHEPSRPDSKSISHEKEGLQTPPLGPVIPPSSVTPALPPNFIPDGEVASVVRPFGPAHAAVHHEIENRHGLIPRGSSFHHHPADFSDSDSDTDTDDDGDGDDHNNHKKRSPHIRREESFRGIRGHAHHHPQLDDRSFPGALGFGAEGDLCLYQHASQLSHPCSDAIDNVYALRESYYQESQEGSSHGHCFLAMFFVIAALGVFLIRKWRGQKKRKEMRSFLDRLHKDAELKAAVEGRLGMSIPEVPKGCPYHRVEGENSSSPRHASCMGKVFYTLFFLLFALVASFFITVTSLIVTGFIVRTTGMEEVDSETGEVTKQPSSFVVLLILFAICSIQVCFVAKLVRAIKQWYHRSYSEVPSNESSQPSASSSSSRSPFPSRALRTWANPRMAAIRTFFQRTQQHDGYVPLHGQEDSTEMISMGTVCTPHSVNQAQHPPTVTVYTSVPLNTNSTMVPVAATPINSFHFV